MRLKFIKEEDFVNYKKASMFLGTCFCDFKCCKEGGLPTSVCQNEPWSKESIKEYDINFLLNTFDNNVIVESFVFGGMEPFLQIDEILDFLRCKSNHSSDKVRNADVVIYTGYDIDEIPSDVLSLSAYPNIIIKFGRFRPNSESRFDELLGVELASNNQYAERIS